ncbi:hypothetical protein AB9F47_30510 [Rhizobium leguminosarum]|uniref:hypothetical protein n=1 Tax=Rhizobium leguminosarum TaxID=384 RepID=UPI003F9D2BEA
MAKALHDFADHSHRARLVAGMALTGAALSISFWHPIPAGYFLLVGMIAFLTVVLDWTRIKNFTFSPTSIGVELFSKIERKVESAESLLSEIRGVEERLSIILTEQMLNRGGQNYNGGFGEQTEFAIYKVLQSSEVAVGSPLFRRNMEDLHRDLGFQLCNGIFGKKWEDGNAVRSWLLSSKYQALPDKHKIEELARRDKVNLAVVSDLLTAYLNFRDRDIVPPDDILEQLYSRKNS